MWYCGKTVEWIRMPLRMVVGVEPGIGVLNFGGDRRRGRGSFGGGKSGTFHCNQWDCVRGDDAAVPKLLWVFSCYIDKAHLTVIFTIVQLFCFATKSVSLRDIQFEYMKSAQY